MNTAIRNCLQAMSTLNQGYRRFPDVFSPAEVDCIANHLSGIESVGSRCLLDHEWCRQTASLLIPRLSKLVSDSFALQIVQFRIVQATYFNKTDTANWFVAFHQDRSIPVSESTSREYRGWSRKEGQTFIQADDELMAQMLALRLHVDDSNFDNGPLRVIPNSHRNGTLSQSEIKACRDSGVEVELTASRGSLIAMRPMVLHASSRSRSGKSRRVIQFLCGPKKLPDGLQWQTAL